MPTRVLLFLILFVAQAVQAAGETKKIIVSIGVDTFEDQLWPKLGFSSQDAERIYLYFTNRKEDPYSFGELLTSKRDGEVGYQKIRASLERLAKENRSEDDTVIVYLSSHGTVAYRPDGSIGRYFIAANTKSSSVAHTAVDYDEIVRIFNSLPSKKKALILAFCHSGIGKSVLTPDMKRALAQLKGPYFEEPTQQYSEGSFVLAASAWREPAIEDTSLGGDVYTHFLLDGFSRDLNGDGVVTISEAHHYAANETIRFTQGRQRPSAVVEQLGADPIVVSGSQKRAGTAMLYAFSERLAQLKVLVNGQPQGQLGKGISLPDGTVTVSFRNPADDSLVATRVVHTRSGREYSASEILQPPLDQYFALGARNISFMSKDDRQQFASGATTGFGLYFRNDDALRYADGAIDIGFFPSVTETVQTEAGDTFTQKRTQASVALLAEKRQKLYRLLTKTGMDWEVFESLGPRFLTIQRSVDDPAFRHSSQNADMIGLSGGVGLILTLPYYFTRATFSYSMTGSSGLRKEKSAISWYGLTSLNVGVFW